MGLTAEQTAIDGLLVRDGPDLVAGIRSLRLIHARFRPGSDPFVVEEVPLPLYWMQYANHEDPERNAGFNARLRILHADAESISVECAGSTASGACSSLVSLTIIRTGEPVRYRYRIRARLEVVSGDGWTVTPNPDHGEVEFANLWPADAFVKVSGRRKRFQSCIVSGSGGILRIPHHHLESSDKHNIPMHPGDRFLWGVEDENPCLQLDSGGNIAAGVCAYMWDAHFAFKVASGNSPVRIGKGALFEAGYSIFSLDRTDAESLNANAQAPASDDSGPVYVDGVNRFSDTLHSPGVAQENVWPWAQEGAAGAELTLDRTRGFDDYFSLRIRRSVSGMSAWKSTSFGPDYGKAAFADGARFQLTARVMAGALKGYATIALRLHREGNGNLFQPETYEMFASPRAVSGSGDWDFLKVVTPPISPPPDRLHLLLVQEGVGESWFDNVLLEVL